jgi:formylglycine-generating enzyme
MVTRADRPALWLLFNVAIAQAGGALGCVPDVMPTAETECSPGERRCSAHTPEVCGDDLQWQPAAACSGDAPFCVAGACVADPPSCAALSEWCGPVSESCCASLPVTGGQFQGGDIEENYLATVNDFELDKFEVTVGRFRQFVDAYPESMPVEGDGAHILIDGSGWREEWYTSLPETEDALRASVRCSAEFRTWTEEAGENESLPVNCVSWFVAFAFCAWDGGRLPTNAEWNYAAAGGVEQRQFPWGDEPGPSWDNAVFDCTGDGSPAAECDIADILPVGSLPDGNGKFGQADLAGSMFEWALDWYEIYTDPCVNCANIDKPGLDTARTAWGGDWSHTAEYLFSYSSVPYSVVIGTPTEVYHGFRCARDL